MNNDVDENEDARAEYENAAEAPGEVVDPLEGPFGSGGHQVMGRDATVEEEDSRELPPEEKADGVRPADTDLTIEDTPG
jgi:hypothetical protein